MNRYLSVLTVRRAGAVNCEEVRVFAGTTFELAMADFIATFYNADWVLDAQSAEEVNELHEELEACTTVQQAQAWLMKVYGFYTIESTPLRYRYK